MFLSQLKELTDFVYWRKIEQQRAEMHMAFHGCFALNLKFTVQYSANFKHSMGQFTAKTDSTFSNTCSGLVLSLLDDSPSS